MTLEEIKKAVQSSKYDFLRTDPHLGNNIILLGLGGSHSYGVATPSSDLDVRGLALRSKAEILTSQDFEQIVDKDTDTTIYSFDKMVKLLISQNPNTIEIMGLKPEHYLYISPIGQELLDNVDLFISKKCVDSFKGYASAQLYRLKQATTGMKNQSELEEHILNTLRNMVNSFHGRYTDFTEDSINLYIDESQQKDYDTEIFMDLHLTHYPVRDWRSMWSELNNTVKSYSKLGKRNKNAIEKDKLGKHMYSLVRLPYMCIDILNGNGIITYREKEHDLLMSMKRNEWLDGRGMPIPKFFELVDDLMAQVDYAAEHSSIPDKPNYEKINEFVASVNERVVTGELG